MNQHPKPRVHSPLSKHLRGVPGGHALNQEDLHPYYTLIVQIGPLSVGQVPPAKYKSEGNPGSQLPKIPETEPDCFLYGPGPTCNIKNNLFIENPRDPLKLCGLLTDLASKNDEEAVFGVRRGLLGTQTDPDELFNPPVFSADEVAAAINVPAQSLFTQDGSWWARLDKATPITPNSPPGGASNVEWVLGPYDRLIQYAQEKSEELPPDEIINNPQSIWVPPVPEFDQTFFVTTRLNTEAWDWPLAAWDLLILRALVQNAGGSWLDTLVFADLAGMTIPDVDGLVGYPGIPVGKSGFPVFVLRWTWRKFLRLEKSLLDQAGASAIFSLDSASGAITVTATGEELPPWLLRGNWDGSKN